MTLQAKVLTISDSVNQGSRRDGSGQVLVDLLTSEGFSVIERRIAPDGIAAVAEALRQMSTSFAGLVVTTGGTGFSPTDLTPEATRTVIEREAPGLSEAMRAISPLGRLSRGVAGIVGQCLVLNVPGSPKGAAESFGAVADILGHALDLMLGQQPH